MSELTAADIYANTCEFAQASAEADLRRIAKFVIETNGKIPPVEFYKGTEHDRAAGTENGQRPSGAHREPANIKQGSPLSRCNSGLCRG